MDAQIGSIKHMNATWMILWKLFPEMVFKDNQSIEKNEKNMHICWSSVSMSCHQFAIGLQQLSNLFQSCTICFKQLSNLFGHVQLVFQQLSNLSQHVPICFFLEQVFNTFVLFYNSCSSVLQIYCTTFSIGFHWFMSPGWEQFQHWRSLFNALELDLMGWSRMTNLKRKDERNIHTLHTSLPGVPKYVLSFYHWLSEIVQPISVLYHWFQASVQLISVLYHWFQAIVQPISTFFRLFHQFLKST